MKVNLNEKLSAKKTLLILSLFAIFTALLCVILSDILLPVLVALLAALLCFDQGTKKIYAYSTVAAVLAINIIGCFFIGQFLMFWGVYALILAFVIYRFASKGKSKMECVFISTILYSAFIIISFVIFAMIQCGEASLDAVSQYYSQVIENLRVIFVDNMYANISEAYAGTELALSPEMLSQAFDMVISNIISFIFISGFIFSGIAFKIFTATTLRYAEDKEYILNWRFATPSLYAYFYLILIVVSLFTASGTGAFAVCVSNLYNIFMVVYAYIGFNAAHAFLARKRKPGGSFIILLIVTVIFLNFALEILAMIGAFGTIRKNREITA